MSPLYEPPKDSVYDTFFWCSLSLLLLSVFLLGWLSK